MKRWFAVVEGDTGEELWPDGLIVVETIADDHEDIAHARARFFAATTRRPHRVIAMYEVHTYREIFMEIVDSIHTKIKGLVKYTDQAKKLMDGATVVQTDPAAPLPPIPTQPERS